MASYSLNKKNKPKISLLGTGDKLRKLRLAHNLTREQLGEILNCTYQAIANWENGSKMPSLDKCATMADYYKCHIEDLLEIEFFDNIPPLEVHEAFIPYGKDNNLIHHPSVYENYTNTKVLLKNGKPANGIYADCGYILHLKDGYLSDQFTLSGKFLKPAVYSSDLKHTEHWKDGVFHCENGPAIIDGLKNYEEWWIEGKQIEPKK